MCTLFLVIMGLCFTIALPCWMLQPAAERVRNRQPGKQFHLSDLMWLVVLMQMGLAVVVALVDVRYQLRFFLLAFFGALALWWCTLRLLSAAGVTSTAKRGTMMVVVVPLALGMVLVTLPAGAGTLAFLFSLVSSERPYPGEWAALGISVAIIPLVLFGRWLTGWAMAKVDEVSIAKEPGDDSPQA